MVFSSFTFLLLFLPLTILFYFLINEKYRNGFLLLASLVFYAWGGPQFVLVMVGVIIINYYCGKMIDKYDRENKFVLKKRVLIFGIFANLLVLFIFKYTKFMAESLNYFLYNVFGGALDIRMLEKIILPIGISFFIFQSISYIVDVYKKDVKVQNKITNLALFIALFPQLIAGPIVRYNTIEHQLTKRITSFDNVSIGLKLFILGLAKKILIANNMGLVADNVFAQEVEYMSTLVAWIGALAYSMQIYFDFSGYSDMAIGLGLVFGFTLPINFNYPYISTSITEFWRRWHISLSTWFKDYLYIPLGGNRVPVQRMYVNLLIVFMATGIWHGANWTFLLWGLWHGVFLIIEKITGLNKSDKFIFIKWVYTTLIVVFGWVLFRSDNILYAQQYMAAMLGLQNIEMVLTEPSYFLNTFNIIVFTVAVIAATPIFKTYALRGLLEAVTIRSTVMVVCQNTYVIILFMTCLILLAGSTYNPFIYFRF